MQSIKRCWSTSTNFIFHIARPKLVFYLRARQMTTNESRKSAKCFRVPLIIRLLKGNGFYF